MLKISCDVATGRRCVPWHAKERAKAERREREDDEYYQMVETIVPEIIYPGKAGM